MIINPLYIHKLEVSEVPGLTQCPIIYVLSQTECLQASHLVLFLICHIFLIFQDETDHKSVIYQRVLVSRRKESNHS